MRTFIPPLALSIVGACSAAAFATEKENPYNRVTPIERSIINGTTRSSLALPKGLSGNPNACASYGCVGAGGGGD
jgi:hypothetical protein